jgi:3-hydroxyacyl-CoA dehydrogenase
MRWEVKKVAILGAGVMGAQLACLMANAGLEVILMDRVVDELDPNKLANMALKKCLKMKPSPILSKSLMKTIETGNFDTSLDKLREVDWVMEAIIENPEIKMELYKKVAPYLPSNVIFSTNTSGISINKLSALFPESLRNRFCGTHFFNPPRYLKLLEIIPGESTDASLIDYLMEFGEKRLGKKTVLCKDTPAFIANRIGVGSIMQIFQLWEKSDFTISEIDQMTGTLIGRPKTATFKTCDLVGLDTLVMVADYLKATCKEDNFSDNYIVPDFVRKMVETGRIGDKAGKGFYEKVRAENGKQVRKFLDPKTGELFDWKREKNPLLAEAHQIKKLKDRLPYLVQMEGKTGDFYRAMLYSALAFVADKIPEISDDIYKVDDALKAGFGWEMGPFEMWDAIGLRESIDGMQALNLPIAGWLEDMLKKGQTSFYQQKGTERLQYSNDDGNYHTVPRHPLFFNLKDHKPSIIWQNEGCSIYDLGDGVLNCAFHSKMNSLGSEVLEGINEAIDLAESKYKALVIANQGQNFSVGANLGVVFMLALEQEWEELDFAVQVFQNTTMRLRYSSIPTVVVPHGMCLGGGAEVILHADRVHASAESYIGLVEAGVGLIPGGGGTKELAKISSDAFYDGDIQIPLLKERYLQIGMAKVATSALEAMEMGYLKKGRDSYSLQSDFLIPQAKDIALGLSSSYVAPVKSKNILAMGRQALGMFMVGADSMEFNGYISAHDRLIAEKLAYTICGGDLSQPTLVSEQYMLDLERETFLSLLGEEKTLQRIEHMLNTGKPLRN